MITTLLQKNTHATSLLLRLEVLKENLRPDSSTGTKHYKQTYYPTNPLNHFIIRQLFSVLSSFYFSILEKCIIRL